MAPVLSFTAEEVWQLFAQKGEDSVFFQTLHDVPAPGDAPALMSKWSRLRELRDPVRKSIEELRAAGRIGSSLQAEADLHAGGTDYDALASLQDELKYVLLTSAARVHRADEFQAKVAASAHPKCERCWHYRADVNGEGLCGRCVSNLNGPGEPRTHA